MMRGKKKCRFLKEIRQRIAEENDIPLVTQECTHQGECSGTCPKCEQELRYLEQQLARRQALGKKVTVTALAAGMIASLTACPAPEHTDTPSESTALVTENTQPTDDTFFQTVGIVDMSPEETEECDPSVCTEAPTETDETEEPFELEGDVVYVPEE